MIPKGNEHQDNNLTEAETDGFFDELTDLLFDMWNADIKQNENPNTKLCN